MDYILKLTDNEVKHTVQAMGFWQEKKHELVASGRGESHHSLQKCIGNHSLSKP